jgi:hypothetical protein
VILMARSNRKVVPQASAALDRMKFEIANEVGVNLKEGYNGDISARDAGRVGGNMVKRMIEQAERSMSGR